MDNDDLRRGRPTVHIQFDEATAILAGDALLTLAFEIARRSRDPSATRTFAPSFVSGLARAGGLGGMVGGQMFDIEAETAAAPLDSANIARLQAMKTGALLKFSVEAGAIVARATPARRAALAAYGDALGAAFQVADDILDAEGATETSASAPARTPSATRARSSPRSASSTPNACATEESPPRCRRDRRRRPRRRRRHVARRGAVRGGADELTRATIRAQPIMMRRWIAVRHRKRSKSALGEPWRFTASRPSTMSTSPPSWRRNGCLWKKSAGSAAVWRSAPARAGGFQEGREIAAAADALMKA